MNILNFLKWLIIIAIILCFLYGPVAANEMLRNAFQMVVSGILIVLSVLVGTLNSLFGVLGLNFVGAITIIIASMVIWFIIKK